jgi:predicted Zn-dependent protease
MMLSRDEAKQLIGRVISYGKGYECLVTVGSTELAQTRFANNNPTTSGRSGRMAINVTVTKDKQSGAVATDETSEQALRSAVAKAQELARYTPADPEYVEPLGPQKYPEVRGFDETTARAAQNEFVPIVRTAAEAAARKELSASGYVEREAQGLAIGNSAGNFGYTMRTEVNYSVTARTPDGTGSGWASAAATRIAGVDGKALASTAIEKAVLSQNPRRLEPGKYTVVLEPAAVAEMLPLLLSSFNARNADEGRSLLTRKGGGTRLGDKMFSEKITLASDPFDTRNPGLPWAGNVPVSLGGVGQFFFGGGGGGGLTSYLPAQKVTWVEKGVVKQLAYSRYWALKKGVAPTPFSTALTVNGEDHAVEDLIRTTDRGLLVTHFWYIRYVNPQTVQLTGLTRDGLFMIEKGKIAYPVMNFRWNESPANVLANVEMLGRAVRVGDVVVPPMKVREFNFASVSDAV